MTKEEKMKLLERLVKDGNITLYEAFHLLETEKEYIYTQLYTQPYTTWPTFGKDYGTVISR